MRELFPEISAADVAALASTSDQDCVTVSLYLTRADAEERARRRVSVQEFVAIADRTLANCLVKQTVEQIFGGFAQSVDVVMARPLLYPSYDAARPLIQNGNYVLARTADFTRYFRSLDPTEAVVNFWFLRGNAEDQLDRCLSRDEFSKIALFFAQNYLVGNDPTIRDGLEAHFREALEYEIGDIPA